MRATLEDAHEHPVLKHATLGQELFIRAIVTETRADAIEITSLGDPQPKYVLGRTSIEITIQEIR